MASTLMCVGRRAPMLLGCGQEEASEWGAEEWASRCPGLNLKIILTASKPGGPQVLAVGNGFTENW